MYVLVVREADGNETEYDLGGEVILGRDESADIRLGDGSVSRQHARLFMEDGLCYLEDLGSSNGTSIAGRPVVGAVVLEPGQEAQLGSFVIYIEDPDAPSGGHQEDFPATVAGAPALDSQGTFSGPPPAAPEGAPQLEGLGGVAYGQTWDLSTRNSVGRVEGNTIVLADPSISRQHAEVVLRGASIVVRDLGSSNGTFVNDQPISGPQEVFEGDIVRFGDVELQVKAGEMAMPLAAAADGAPPPPIRPGARRSARRGSGGGSGGGGKKKLLLVGATVVVAIIAVAAVLKPKPPPPKPAGNDAGAGGGAAVQKSVAEEGYRLMRQCRAQAEAQEWATAEKLCQQVVELDPINKEARDKLRQIQLDKKMAQKFRDAKSKKDLGDLRIALEIFVEIDKQSYYYGQAQYEVSLLVKDIIKKAAGDCLGNYRARRYKDAVDSCRLHENFACQCPSEYDSTQVRRYLVDSERATKVPVEKRWKCPVEYAQWVPCSAAPVGDCAEAATKRYTDDQVKEAMSEYCQGSALKGMKILKKITDKYSHPSRDQAVDISTSMQVVEGKWKEGQALILKGDPEEAERVWQVMLTADGKIVPDGADSYYRREARKGLHQAYRDKGQMEMNMERYPEAYEWAQKGMRVGKGDPKIKELLYRLEQQAAVDIRRAASCGEFAKILAFTQSDPPSATHKQAQQEMERRGCR
ncbi:MAG: FHA domain-containing protein [Deltaproteobacteria bacterium]|nr:FHA domain-containing protein [Deltaproteobacteria bacterium]